MPGVARAEFVPAAVPAGTMPEPVRPIAWMGIVAVVAVAAALHIATNGRYGFHRDELQFLDDGRHLAWGYVAYPPLAPLMARLAFWLFGGSLQGLRLFALLAQLLVLVLTALLAREFGGGRFAQTAAALCVAAAPLPMFEAHSFQYTGFDLLWCVVLVYCLVRAVDAPRAGARRRGGGDAPPSGKYWWLAAGAVAGLGLMTKYTMAFYLGGLLVGILASRRVLLNRWLWWGVVLAFAFALPNLLWQVRHGWVSLYFLRFIHARDIAEGRAAGFWPQQWGIDMQDFAAPLALAGLAWFWVPAGRCYRFLGWMFVVVVAAMWLARGRGYYTAAVYPMLFAAGAVVWERVLARLPRSWARCTAAAATLAVIAVGGALTARNLLPLQPLTARNNVALARDGDLREEVGWPELVREVARIRDTLPPPQRAGLAVVTNNYGETGAIDLFGPAYGLPPAISTTNSAWLRGYPATPPRTVILLGSGRAGADRYFEDCRLAGRNTNPYGVHNEESDDHPDIFLCGPLRLPWARAWPKQPAFG